MKYKTITIGDNSHVQRRRSAEGLPIYVERMGRKWQIGDRLRVRWRDEFQVVDGDGVYEVVCIEPSEHMPQGAWFSFGLCRVKEGSPDE